MSLGADLASLRDLRRALDDWLEQHYVPANARAALVLATHEAAVNAIEHARADETAVAAEINGALVTVSVTNAGGRWTEAHTRGEDRGRGLTLIRGLMTDIDIRNDGKQTTAVLHLEF